MSPLWSFQPFKAIYAVVFPVIALAKLALLSLLYVPRSLRPLPEWSLKLCVTTVALREYFRFITAIRYQRAPQLEPGKAQDCFVLVDPPEARFFSGVLAPTVVKPAPVGAMWHSGPVERGAADARNQKIVLQFAGGAFVLGSDPDVTGRSIGNIMTRHLKVTNTLFAQCRLANTPETRFPAAVQDVLSTYCYVLSLGVSPKDIILSGDSSGGNLVIAPIRYRELPDTQLPKPGKLWEESAF